jgi:hypothetical protein
VSFSPDGRYLAIGTNGPVALVVDVRALADGTALEAATVFDREVHATRAPSARVIGGELLATSGADGVYRFWALESGEMMMELEVTGLLGGGAFDISPDGAVMYYEDGDGIIRHMPIDVEELIRVATSAARRSLTEDECRAYLHAEQCR